MKRLGVLLVAIFLLLMSMPAVAQSETMLTLDCDDDIRIGTSIDVTVQIDNAVNFDAASYAISFRADAVAFTGVSQGSIDGKYIGNTFNQVGSVIYMLSNATGISSCDGSGILAVLHFDVIAGNDLDGVQFMFQFLPGGVVSDVAANETPVITVGKLVTIINVIPGDANGDRVLNALDITSVERQIVLLDPATPGADANGDGELNALDITKTERLIAGLG